jgi:hypothetical protein
LRRFRLIPIYRWKLSAIAVQDRRANVLDFIQNHKDYKFLFFTDPDMDRETSQLDSFFGIAAIGIPITVLADHQRGDC